MRPTTNVLRQWLERLPERQHRLCRLECAPVWLDVLQSQCAELHGWRRALHQIVQWHVLFELTDLLQQHPHMQRRRIRVQCENVRHLVLPRRVDLLQCFANEMRERDIVLSAAFVWIAMPHELLHGLYQQSDLVHRLLQLERQYLQSTASTVWRRAAVLRQFDELVREQYHRLSGRQCPPMRLFLLRSGYVRLSRRFSRVHPFVQRHVLLKLTILLQQYQSVQRW